MQYLQLNFDIIFLSCDKDIFKCVPGWKKVS